MIVLDGIKGDVTHLAFSPSARVLAASGGGRGLELWSLPSGDKWGRYSRGMRFHDGPVFFHPTQPLCFAQGGTAIGEIETDTKKARMLALRGKGLNFLNATAMTADGSGFVCQCNGSYYFDGNLRLLSWRRGEDLDAGWTAKLGGPTSPHRATPRVPTPRVIRVSPAGDTFLTLDAEAGRAYWPDAALARVTVRAGKNGKLLRSADLPAGTLPVLTVAPDGDTFVTCRTNGLDVWDANDLKTDPRRVKGDGRSRFTGAAFHPSGKYLAATCNDATVRLYDTSSWRVSRTFTWEVGRMRGVAFSPDGALAAAGGDTGKVVVWDVDL